jgi:hypothetical protein
VEPARRSPVSDRPSRIPIVARVADDAFPGVAALPVVLPAEHERWAGEALPAATVPDGPASPLAPVADVPRAPTSWAAAPDVAAPLSGEPHSAVGPPIPDRGPGSGIPAGRPRRPGLGEPLTDPLDLQRIAVPAGSVATPAARGLVGSPEPEIERAADHTVLAIRPRPDAPPRSDDVAAPGAGTGPDPALPLRGKDVPVVARVPDGPARSDDALPPVPSGFRIVPLLGARPPAGPTPAGQADPRDDHSGSSPGTERAVATPDQPVHATPAQPVHATPVQRVPASPYAQPAVGTVGSAVAAWPAGGAVSSSTDAGIGTSSEERGSAQAVVRQLPRESVQRLDAPAPDPTAPPAAVPSSSTSSPESTPAAPAAGPGAAPTSGAALDELVRRLYDPLSARLKDELRLDRERAGVITDLRR